VELAFAAPFLALLLVGMADLGRGFSERYSLQSAANRTVERANLGTSTTDYSFLRGEAADAAGVPIENVTYEGTLDCDGIRQASFDAECAPTQEIMRYISIRIEKDFVPSFTWNGGAVRIAGEASVRIQ
jgi:hypothetical protein